MKLKSGQRIIYTSEGKKFVDNRYTIKLVIYFIIVTAVIVVTVVKF